MDIKNYEQSNEELKKCPFCGSAPVWYLRGGIELGRKRTVVVNCKKCGTVQETGVVKMTTLWACEQAVKRWNMRYETDNI